MTPKGGKPGYTGLKRIFKATLWSYKGLRAALKYESAFRQELLLFSIMTPLAFWLGNNGVERALLVASAALVLIVELLNSAVEAVVDRVGLERHKLSGRAKDFGSAAVFVALLNVLVVWGAILADHYL